ncbi:MAG: hypothetical protein EZS28_011795 [Streblomastix strix]|uniref:Uncharacterized protein n=1 Tax=Streblomastix strix TaxID=222440 RepID=A0A5J4WCW3_9EUKA|nr:MAG: hypothetical protein EZS28_011795 [Streblomastix strix]
MANFRSKILGGVKKAAQWVAPALHKVLSTISGPVGMIHPGIGGALGAGANLAGAVDRLKRGGSSCGMMSNDEYQLFIDNNNALVYAANNQIVDGIASDFALKIEPNGLLTELSRQTHFRGYYLLNTDIQNIPNSANGDFSFSAESGTVWMYDQNWYNSGDIVPDQVTPASDATPLSDDTATAEISTEYSLGTTNYYARSDHFHPQNITTTIPPSDWASGSVGTTNYYARNDHSHPINVETNASNIPIVNGVCANGTSAYYARQDHVHPQQLTYDVSVTATKFIKTGGPATEILCANGDTTIIDKKFSRTYYSGAGGYIRLCVFPTGIGTGAPYIQLQVICNTNAKQTIDLVSNYTVNGIIDLYGNITAPLYVQPAYNIYYGVDQLLLTHTGSYSTAAYFAWIHMMSGSGSVTVTVINQSSYMTNRITEIQTQDIVSSITGSQTQIPIAYNLGNGGIINNMLQVNTMNRSYTTYNNGIRIGNYSNYSALYLGCDTTAINTTKAVQWEISKTNDNALTITPSTLQQDDHSVGLSINSDSSIIKLNGKELVNVGTNQTVTGRKTFAGTTFGSFQLNPTDASYDEGIRIVNSPIFNVSAIYIGTSTSSSVEIDADRNTLTFNGSVIAGTGATNGASNGSVNYSAGNPILWAKPVTLGAVPP